MPTTSLVLYCIIRRKRSADAPVEFLLIHKQHHMTFPPTKFRPYESLYAALERTMQEDLGLPPGSYYAEEELAMIPNEGESPRYPGLSKKWFLYPVVLFLAPEALMKLEEPADHLAWWSLDEIRERDKEPNVLAIAGYLHDRRRDLLEKIHPTPSMDAIASHWAAHNGGGSRVLRKDDIRKILGAGSRAFNLRVADPYLPYQKQGLGFTWSFFTPKNKQDVHVHGLPAVEIYGVIEGRLQIWHKPMNQRGVRTWRADTLSPGDWMEIEPLNCHFALWLDKEGLGTVIKAAASGELAGVGRLDASGKTLCRDCNVHEQCTLHPDMIGLLDQYQKPYEERDYALIASLAACVDNSELSPKLLKDGGKIENLTGNPPRPDKEELSDFCRPVLVVRILIPDQEGRLLILRRTSTAYSSGAWCLPGGKIDYGKTAEEALIQELREETSLECEDSKFLFWQDSLPTEGVATMHCINFYFECRVSGTIALNEESSEFAWVGPEDLPQYEVVFRNDIAMLRYWKEREDQNG